MKILELVDYMYILYMKRLVDKKRVTLNINMQYLKA